MNSESIIKQLTSNSAFSAAQQDQIAISNDNQSNGHLAMKPELFCFSLLYKLCQVALVSEANEEELCTRDPSGKQLHHQEHPGPNGGKQRSMVCKRCEDICTIGAGWRISLALFLDGQLHVSHEKGEQQKEY